MPRAATFRGRPSVQQACPVCIATCAGAVELTSHIFEYHCIRDCDYILWCIFPGCDWDTDGAIKDWTDHIQTHTKPMPNTVTCPHILKMGDLTLCRMEFKDQTELAVHRELYHGYSAVLYDSVHPWTDTSLGNTVIGGKLNWGDLAKGSVSGPTPGPIICPHKFKPNGSKIMERCSFGAPDGRLLGIHRRLIHGYFSETDRRDSVDPWVAKDGSLDGGGLARGTVPKLRKIAHRMQVGDPALQGAQYSKNPPSSEARFSSSSATPDTGNLELIEVDKDSNVKVPGVPELPPKPIPVATTELPVISITSPSPPTTPKASKVSLIQLPTPPKTPRYIHYPDMKTPSPRVSPYSLPLRFRKPWSLTRA
ncbi:hypothetical protein QCA50_005381 [Cerrena zonata]|uniref:C2H2-type domain-containing protein n=1 Tax=Cerrena zonata TaxID=2478898 RepID=A0AAW0GGR0_9APHY